jgi:hypothetical protein
VRTPLSDLKSAVGAWDRFFFRPADPTPLGLIRAATGALLLWSLGVVGLDLRGFLGSDGWADPEVVRQTMGHAAWSFWLWMPDAALWPTWAACMVVLLLFTLGYKSRVTAPLAWAIAVSTNRRVPVMLFGFDSIVATWAFYLAVTGASGQAFSLDRLLAARRRARGAAKGPGGPDCGPPAPTVSANLALRLIQLNLCLIYAVAGLAKLRGDAWWDGRAFGMLLGNSEFRPFDLSWLVAYPMLVSLGTHATIALELLYPVLVWGRGLRPWVLAITAVMHVGIILTLGLLEFSLVMLAANLAFVPGDWLRGWGPTRRGRGPSEAVESGSDPGAGARVATRAGVESRRVPR